MNAPPLKTIRVLLFLLLMRVSDIIGDFKLMDRCFADTTVMSYMQTNWWLIVAEMTMRHGRHRNNRVVVPVSFSVVVALINYNN